MITVYGRATSSNVQAVMWGIGELGLAHERLDYGHVYGGTDTPEFRAMSPHGTVPVMRDGDVVIWESCAILRFLAARYGAGADSNVTGAFWPSDAALRAGVDMWAEWGKTSFAPYFTVPIFWSRVRTSAADRDKTALKLAVADFETRLDILQGQLQGRDFVVSDDFTLADIVIGHVLYRWFDIDITRKPRPLIEAYHQRLTERHPYREHVAISYDALRTEGS